MNIHTKKIMFLGYGAVAKCVWAYLGDFFNFDRHKVFLVDKTKDAFNGPNLHGTTKIVLRVDSTNFEELLDKLKFKKHDIIIDLSTFTATYFFIKACLLRGIHYINTSIEDGNDEMLGSSIDCQQRKVASIVAELPHKSTVLTECGQNPGMIQHYILHALSEMQKLNSKLSPKKSKSPKKRKLLKVIDDYQVGTILMSEIDNMVSTTKLEPGIIYNTWSVAGYVFESMDKTELVQGKMNPYIKPIIPTDKINKTRTAIYDKIRGKSDYDVVFLEKNGFRTSLNSVCPVLEDDKVVFQKYRGKLIHHGEVTEMARYFGKNAPFMSYVYKTNASADKSIESFLKTGSEDDLATYVNQENNFKVFKGTEMKGHDSIGCTIFCGKDKIERIFWCGSILSTQEVSRQEYTPTIVQVAAGILAGLSYMMEHPNLGWIESSDIDTAYMLGKAKPLLGKLMFLEIPVDEFGETFMLV